MSQETYSVSATIHGPAGWFDVFGETRGVTVAVCPRLAMARRIAALLTEHAGCKVQPAPVVERVEANQ